MARKSTAEVIEFDQNSPLDKHVEKMLKKIVPIVLEGLEEDYNIERDDSESIQNLLMIPVRETIVSLTMAHAIPLLESNEEDYDDDGDDD